MRRQLKSLRCADRSDPQAPTATSGRKLPGHLTKDIRHDGLTRTSTLGKPLENIPGQEGLETVCLGMQSPVKCPIIHIVLIRGKHGPVSAMSSQEDDVVFDSTNDHHQFLEQETTLQLHDGLSISYDTDD